MPNNEPSSGQRGKTLSRFKKWLREKYPRVYGFFFSETPFYIHHFFGLLVSLGFLGGFLALTVPLWKSWNSVPFLGLLIPAASTDYSEPKAIADLRLHILYITGGIIAILTLLQTNWKNQVDRRKVEADIKKNEQDAEKNERDHIRQVHAERRSRYTKAVEQLANEKAPVRLGGIYTLVGLVDEWLADDTLDPEEQQKEGQIIINNLCAYIRSPFPLGEIQEYIDSLNSFPNYKDIYSEDNAAVREERDIRQSILKEIQSRLRSIEISSNNNDAIQEGPWSIFAFNFSSALFFYPVDFSNSYFSKSITFLESIFIDSVDFEKSTFKETVIFDSVDFYGTTKETKVSFNESNFEDCVQFRDTTFISPLYFNNTIFLNDVSFEGSGFYTKQPSPSIISFAGAKFSRGLSFRNAYLEHLPVFLSSTQENFHRTKFSYNMPPNSYNFCVNDSSKKIIPLQDLKYKNKTYTIPIGCALFDPDNPSQPEIISTL